MTGHPVSEPRVANPQDEKLRLWLDLHLETLSTRLDSDREKIDAQDQEIRRQNREILSMKRTLGLLKKEREQMRSILRSLENRLLTLQEKSNEPGAPQKD
ncbi:MAG: hypothetical protein VST70_09470 [Nitrospirota bacterium]|nr:hypothetical protein [Nitrospirota bacterium]